MSKSERVKGAEGEREVARIYRARGFDVDRVPNSGGLRIKGDLHGDVPEHIEVKRQEIALPACCGGAFCSAGACCCGRGCG